MKHNSTLAIIGSGPTGLFYLQHILENSDALLKRFDSISIFEKYEKMGYGMPYNPKTTDSYHLANISSEEIPKLPQTLAEWLQSKSKSYLKTLKVEEFPIQKSKVYSRLALGEYFHAQYTTLVENLRIKGFKINEYGNCQVDDIRVINETEVRIISKNLKFEVNQTLIATGHNWKQKDKPKCGYYDSPWPIFKLLPKDGSYFNFEVGILGASLSAFDVVTSLAHRHGKFVENNEKLTYTLFEGADNFKIMLHDATGLLPHLQYEQVNPFRKIYRHTSREELLKLKSQSKSSFLQPFFIQICKSVLHNALVKDKLNEIAVQLEHKDFTFENFIEIMTEQHSSPNSFEGMREDIDLADKLLKKNKPVHWMETLDDLMYCLNFHAEFMTAEDHLFFNKKVKPFLMNVIAALPLDSANILMALFDADCIALTAGKVEVLNHNKKHTEMEVTSDDDSKITKSYKMFINSSGNDVIEFSEFPFQSLKISPALAEFKNQLDNEQIEELTSEEKIELKENKVYLKLDGIAIDSGYNILESERKASKLTKDLAFNHTLGIRPYSYGLQACNATSSIAINSLIELDFKKSEAVKVEEISKIYNKNDEL